MCGNKLKMFLIEVKPNLSDSLLTELMVFSFHLTVSLKVIKLIFSRTVFFTRIAAEYGSLCPVYEPPCLLLYRPISMTSPRNVIFCLRDPSLMQWFFTLYLMMWNRKFMRAGNMLLHFSLSNLNKRACRVLKWLAIETIDEQLFLHEARTG